MKQMITILHMSDLHFSLWDQEEELVKKWEGVENAVLAFSDPVQYLAVTGDITSHGKTQEFQCATKYLEQFVQSVGIKKSNVFFCPGNHDADSDFAESTFLHYHRFCSEFYENIPILNEHINITVMDSCTQSSLEDYDNAIILDNEIKKAKSRIRKEQKNILLIHHPAKCYQEQSNWKKLCKLFDVILCGHLHPNQPTIEKYEGATVITGMALTPHLKSITSGFQRLIIEENQLQIDIYSKDSKGNYFHSPYQTIFFNE